MVRESKHVKPADNLFFYMPQFGAGTPRNGSSEFLGRSSKLPQLFCVVSKKEYNCITDETL